MDNTYNPTWEEMILANRGYIKHLPLQECLKEYLLENERGIVEMMDNINNVDNTLDYKGVFLLVVQVFLRRVE